MRRLRVLLVGSFGLGLKGTLPARAAPMGRALRRLGHDARLVFVPWDCPAESGRRFDLDGLPAFGLARSRRPESAAFHLEHMVRLGGWLARELIQRRPDFVHVFKPKAYGGAVALALGRLRRAGLPRPRVVVDTDDWEGAGGWADLDARRPEARPPAWQRAVAAWQEPAVLRAADAVTVASRALETLVWGLGVAPGHVHYLPNALEDAELARLGAVAEQRRAGAASGPGEPRLLLYSRFFEFDPRRFAAAMARVRAAHPTARLLVLGEALAGEDRAFRAALAAAGVDGMADFAGWPGRDAAARYFAECALAVVPTDDHLINRTRSSFKLLELLGAGVPVVAEAVGQNAVVLDAGRSGLLVEPGDEAAFAGAVVGLLEAPAEAATLGEAARRRVVERFRWSAQSGELEAAYRMTNML